MTRRHPWVIVFAVAAAVGYGAPAAAQSPVFAPPQVLATQGRDVVAAMGPGGDVVVAWAGNTNGVFAARRAALGGAFSAPVRVSDDRVDPFSRLRLARNDRGDLALAWIRPIESPGGPAVLRLVVAPDGAAGFAAPEDVVSTEALVDHALAVGDDGTAAVAFKVRSPDSDAFDAYVARRAAGGGVGQPQLLARRVLARGAQLAAGPGGSLHAIWLAQTSAADAVPRRNAVFTAETGPGAGFGPARMLSDPALNGGSDILTPRLAANRRGDLLAGWAGSPPGTPLYGTRADVTARPVGGDWSAPRELAGPFKAVIGVSPALNDVGDAVVAWGDFSHVETTFRPAGADFRGLVNTQVPTSPDFEGLAIGLDALGVTLIVRRQVVGNTDGPGQIFVLLRARDGIPGPDVPVSGVEQAISAPSVATDPFGNGIVAWSSRGGARPVTAAVYSALAPVVAGVRAGSRELRFRASEPATMRITVRRDVRGGKSASQTAIAKPGANNVRYASKVRQLLRRKGRYVATIRARDAGPSSRTIKVRFRRR